MDKILQSLKISTKIWVITPYEVRSEALCNENPVQYPIPENKAIQKYKA